MAENEKNNASMQGKLAASERDQMRET
jgi:hypothetical protein